MSWAKVPVRGNDLVEGVLSLLSKEIHAWTRPTHLQSRETGTTMIRKLKSGKYRLYSRKTDPKTGQRRNLGTFDSREAAEKHEREVQYFKRH